jgi:hypothetical protein
MKTNRTTATGVAPDWLTVEEYAAVYGLWPSHSRICTLVREVPRRRRWRCRRC